MHYGITLILFFTFLNNSTFAKIKEPYTSIALIGDSTVTETKGWGRSFQSKFSNKVKIYNFAASGRSSKSWHNEKRLANVLKLKPKYVFIQFGHNGQPGKGPERETDPNTTYKKYLTLYVQEFKKNGTIPIIVSSLTRRKFNSNGVIESSLTPWAKAAKETAIEQKIPFIDLHTLSINYHNRIGKQESMKFNPKKDDVTHLNERGAKAICEIIFNALKTSVPELFAMRKET